jgi:ABC-2 type transport system ATP-binding protein
MLFEIEHLSKSFGDIAALSDVTFQVRAGEVLGLIGPNGAGKTTLFECLAGVLPCDGGKLRANGEEIPGDRRSTILFYVPDQIAPWGAQSLRWALDYTTGFFGGRQDLRDELVGELDLGPLLRRPIAALSKGQRKRALLAIGLLTPQPALLIDEPFDGLDLRQTRDVAARLRTHAGQGRTLFLSIHQIGDAARFCDRFVLLSSGRVRGEGTVSELASKAASDTPRVHLAVWRRSFLRSHKPPFLWLLEKEFRDLAVSRSWWILLLSMGPLVGVSFINAVRTYGEVSGFNGTAGGVGEAMSPLVGVWAPTFSACELAAVFLLPFVVIRLVGGDRQNGALKLELQRGMSTIGLVVAKVAVALTGWLIVMLPSLTAIPLWKSYGGSVYPPELATLVFGHVLNAGLTIALGAAMASIAEHPATAAILTLAVTIGTWLVDFFAAIQGGWWERAAAYTPAALVAEFQHGLVRLSAVLIAIVLIMTGLGVSAIWMRLGTPLMRRTLLSVCIVMAAACAIFGCTFVRASWDTSESRGNSFPEATSMRFGRSINHFGLRSTSLRKIRAG